MLLQTLEYFKSNFGFTAGSSGWGPNSFWSKHWVETLDGLSSVEILYNCKSVNGSCRRLLVGYREYSLGFRWTLNVGWLSSLATPTVCVTDALCPIALYSIALCLDTLCPIAFCWNALYLTPSASLSFKRFKRFEDNLIKCIAVFLGA